MKYLFGSVLEAVILFSFSGAGVAIPPTPVPQQVQRPKAAVVIPASQPAPAPTSQTPSKSGPILHQFDLNMGDQFHRMNDAKKSGKLTEDQHKAFMDKMKEIHLQKWPLSRPTAGAN